MSLFRFLSLAICRHQKMSLVLVVFIIALVIIFQAQNENPPTGYAFEDSVEYCNAPNRNSRLNNRSFNNFALIQVQVLIRHGDRAPIDLQALPNTAPVHISCSFNETPYMYDIELAKIKHVSQKNIFHVKGSKKDAIVDERPACLGGQLTPFGYLQHLYLGELFKVTYRELLIGINLGGDLHVQSTDLERTIQSGTSFLIGAFYDKLVEESPKVVVNVHKDHIRQGHFLLDENGNDLECPALSRKSDNAPESRSVKFFLTNVEPIVQKMANILLVPRRAMPAYNRLVDILFTKLCHGQGVPLGPSYRLPNSLVNQALQFSGMYVKVFHSGLAELQTLSILSQVTLRFLDLIRNLPNAKKIVLYSGHDTTVAPFLQLLGSWDGKWPPYASNIFIEFYEKSDSSYNSLKGRITSTYFRVIYNGVTLKSVKFCKTFAEDDELCPVSYLLKYVSNEIYDDSVVDSMVQSTLDEVVFSRIRKLCLSVD